VVTLTSAVPAGPGGLTAVRPVEETKVTFFAATLPKATLDPAMKFLPEMLTTVPPPVGPWDGEILDTTGAEVPADAEGTGAKWSESALIPIEARMQEILR
jgi:hypothetical protein